ncbi:MAG: hypothetical protein IKL83_04035 [Muribaculaceae bacterium]|nr:hypothetical protein [Muribaculaceae bacterium]
MRKLTITLLLVVVTACHSKKDIASTVTADTNTISSSDLRVSSSKLDSALYSLAITLDSPDITAEPVLLAHCPDSGDIRPDVIAWRYHIKANNATINADRTAVSRAHTDTLQQDSINSTQAVSAANTEHCESTSVYKPPDTTLILILFVLIFAIVIYRKRSI